MLYYNIIHYNCIMNTQQEQENRRLAIESALRLCPLNYTNTSFKIEELIKNAQEILKFLNNK